MDQASARQDYETASIYRDRIATLKRMQEKQYIIGDSGDADVLAVAVQPEGACIEVGFIRNGAHLGSKTFFPKTGAESSPEAILAGFLPQYYLGKSIPPRIYVSRAIPDNSLLEAVFTEQTGHRVKIAKAARGTPKGWMRMTELNALEHLRRWRTSRLSLAERFEALRAAFRFEALPERIECFDVSHTRGEATVAACVVFDQNGPVKSDYRRFNIDGIEPGDDYAALTQALTRRYKRIKAGEGRLPDLLLVDGGKGQLAVAESVLQELQIAGVRLMAVSKGPTRKPGQEQLFLSGTRGATILAATSPALHLIQQIRDEAHRFAITAHRQRRGKTRTTSLLERIPGIGDRRRQTLLKNFGGLREVARAGVEDLAKVPGINRALAQRIYDVLHEQEH
jgi:excinuclease ABC subunit C